MTKKKEVQTETKEPANPFENFIKLAQIKRDELIDKAKKEIKNSLAEQELKQITEAQKTYDDQVKKTQDLLIYIHESGILDHKLETIKDKLKLLTPAHKEELKAKRSEKIKDKPEVLAVAYKEQQTEKRKLKKETSKDTSLDDLGEPEPIDQASLDLSGEINKAEVNDE